MKICALVLSASLVVCGCQRHSAEETEASHEEHSGSHNQNFRGGLSDPTMPKEHEEKTAPEAGH